MAPNHNLSHKLFKDKPTAFQCKSGQTQTVTNGKITCLDGTPWWLWVIIGIVVLVAVVSVILCCWCYCRKKRRNQEIQGNNSAVRGSNNDGFEG